MSSTLHVRRVVELGSRRLLHNLTDMRRKPLAFIGLHVAMVPESYHRSVMWTCPNVSKACPKLQR
jgi:hypothetical protein